MKTRELELSLVCDKCHSHKLWLDFVEDEIDGNCHFVVCAECGFDRETTEDDFTN